MLISKFFQTCFEPETGASAGGESGGGAAAPDTSSGSTVGGDLSRGVMNSDPSMDGGETPVDDLKKGILQAGKDRRDRIAKIQYDKDAINPATAATAAVFPATVAPVAPAVPAYQPGHYQWGEHFGLSKPQVESFGSPQAFEGWLSRVRANQAQPQRQQSTEIQNNQQFNQNQNQQQQQVPAQPQGYQPFKLEGDASDYEPSVVKLVEHFNGQMDAMHKQLSAHAQSVNQFGQVVPTIQQLKQAHVQQQQREDQASYASINQQLEALDADTFGKHVQGQPLDQNFLNARFRIGDELSRLEAGYRSRGEALPPLAQLVDTAHRMAFGYQIAQRALAQAAQKSRDLRGQTSAVPTHRQGQQLTGREKAVRTIADKLKEQSATQGAEFAGTY